jgi:PilZ domain
VNFSEQRKSVRFNGEIPLEVKVGTGITRDFSTNGIYFITDQILSVGEQLGVVMLLERNSLRQVWRFRCEGEVLRVEPTGGKTGVAFAITSRTFDGSVGVAQPNEKRL